jgi:hypothetical protein
VDSGQSVQVMEKDGSSDRALRALFSAIVSGDHGRVTRLLKESPCLAARPIRIGATRQDPDPYFLVAIRHYVYAGDTALHVAAAAYQRELAEVLVVKGADVRASNRRGAEPLHYAADGSPQIAATDRDAQSEMISYLIEAGADPNALDKSGVAPLHRAVRSRSSLAVDTLIEMALTRER